MPAINNALSPCSALRLQPDSPETLIDLDHPGKSLPVNPRTARHDVVDAPQTQSEELVTPFSVITLKS